MKYAVDQHRRAVDYQEEDQVLFSTRYLQFKYGPKKLKQWYVGPFPIIQKIGTIAYKLQLPEHWSMHPVFHTSLLRPWRESQWSCLVDIHASEIEAPAKPYYEVDKILKWRKTKHGRCTIREFLVTWSGYPLEEA